MDKSDIAGILGLLLGGAGGYYGGKKRGEREDKKLADYFDMMKESQGGSDGSDVNTKILNESGNKSDFSTDSVIPNNQESIIGNLIFDQMALPTSPEYLNIGGNILEYIRNMGISGMEQFKDLEYNPFYENEDGTPKTQFNDGGRVGLANGGLGYSYKNNIFSADPSTGIPAIVDAGGDDGVADDTFMDLFPGLFPPVETQTENILDTPVMPMGGGGGDGPPDFMVGNPGYETFGDLVSDVTSGFGLFGPQTGDYSEDPKARPELSYSPIGSSVDGEEENSFFGFNLPNFADLPTPTNTFFNKLGEIRDFLSNAITNPDKGDPDPKDDLGPKTPSVNSTVPTKDQLKSGGGNGKGPSTKSGKGQDTSGKGQSGGKMGGDNPGNTGGTSRF